MNKYELENFVKENPKLVSMKPVEDGLFILKYRKNVFYDNLWNDYIEECRGTIVDADFNVVARPFTKVYNYGIEARAPKLSADTRVSAYRKVNGFMVAATWYKDRMIVSTTGSTDSPFVTMAKEMMEKHMPMAMWESSLEWSKGRTLMFECVHPNDPHIVVEDAGMYLLGWRENTWESVVDGWSMADNWRVYALAVLRCKYAEHEMCTIEELMEKTKRAKHEGYVFYTEDNVSSKIKSPYYLTSKWVARNPRTDKLMDMKNDIKKNLDEEYYPLVDAIRANIVEYSAMDEQARLAWVRNFVGEV